PDQRHRQDPERIENRSLPGSVLVGRVRDRYGHQIFINVPLNVYPTGERQGRVSRSWIENGRRRRRRGDGGAVLGPVDRAGGRGQEAERLGQRAVGVVVGRQDDRPGRAVVAVHGQRRGRRATRRVAVETER